MKDSLKITDAEKRYLDIAMVVVLGSCVGGFISLVFMFVYFYLR
jgi:hypothetical protein